MKLLEYYNTNWHRGNVVKLNNGKEYEVKGIKSHGRYLLLYSAEFDARFVADYRIVDCRTSDYEEPEEVYLEKKRKHLEAVEAKREEERLERLKAKAERKLRNLQEQERIHQEALARKAAKVQKHLEENKKKMAEKQAKKAETVAKAQPQPKAEPVAKAAPAPKSTPAPKAEAAPKPTPAAKVEPAPKAEPAPEQPKKKRKRIAITRVEKVEIK